MDDDGELIFVGAEAEVRRASFFGIPSVRKRRVPKTYRRPELDERIRRERTKAEAQLVAQAQRAGIRTPRVLDVDVRRAAIEFEHVEGDPLRVVLERHDAQSVALCRLFGRAVGQLHAAGIVHGDLTTSNLIANGEGLVLLDFGLAQWSDQLEDRGVDLHLVERTFEASHPGRGEFLASFNRGYAETFPGAAAVLHRVEEIKARGRYV